MSKTEAELKRRIQLLESLVDLDFETIQKLLRINALLISEIKKRTN